jgi:hypothetical protein
LFESFELIIIKTNFKLIKIIIMKKLLLTFGLFAGFAAFANDNNALTATNTSTANVTSATTIASTETAGDEASSFGENEEEIYWESGFSSVTEVGASFIYNQRFANFYQAVGGRINPYLFIGGGVGVQVKSAGNYQFQLLTDIRVNPLNKRVTPIFFTQFGLNKVGPETLYNKEQKYLGNNQFNLNLGTGILVKALPNAAFTLNGGYSLFTDFGKSMHGAFVKIGYVF